MTLSVWHYYDGRLSDAMEQLIAEFNENVGSKDGIIVNIVSVTDSKEQERILETIARDDPGSPELPDLVTAYPFVALELQQAGLLAALDGYVSPETLAKYVPEFIDEGRLPDGKLYSFPVAKSTESLFVNRTLFSRFSEATGVSMETLSTFEGLAKTALRYYEWTDLQTPDIPNDGKSFFTPDSWFNLAQVQTAQLGSQFVGEDSLKISDETFQRVWDFAVPPALQGAYAIGEGYSSVYARTGEVITTIGSTAGVTYYGDSVTYPDNTQETIEWDVLPYPVLVGGQKVALQRGAGFVVRKSDPRREQAAVKFLEWLTQPEQNLRFVRSTGYLPVTKEAFGQRMAAEIDITTDPQIKRLLIVATDMFKEYKFIVNPNQANLSQLETSYQSALKKAMLDGRAEIVSGAKLAEVDNAKRAAFEA
ncbi:MAG: extracellular solute-binding protein [Propionibacteriaceae bacterium]|nr:extracellular solute-binding protein [Propionibacteriaceae bacterium]